MKLEVVMGRHLLRLGQTGHFILLGIGSIMDISGMNTFVTRSSESPLSAIGRDFQKVGGDLAFVMGNENLLNEPNATSSEKQLELSIR